MAPRDTALQTTAGGSIPPHSQGELDHSNPQPQPLQPSSQDMTLVGLRLGNWISAAVYGVRGEYR